MDKSINVVNEYFYNVIMKSWTWDKLTDEERQRFMDMKVFGRIKGNEKTRIEWLCTIYESYLAALGYESVGWRKDGVRF